MSSAPILLDSGIRRNDEFDTLGAFPSHKIQMQGGARLRRGRKAPGHPLPPSTPTLTQLKGCFAKGYPFVVGFTVYEGSESPAVAKNGTVPLPGRNDRSIGGHAVLATGYDDRRQHFIVMNSWSAAWESDKGCF